MAILFSCPYCTASVKVPDQAAGKVGTCPKCGTKIRVPTIEIPTLAHPTPSSPNQVTAPSPSVSHKPETVGPGQPSPGMLSYPASTQTGESTFPDLFSASPHITTNSPQSVPEGPVASPVNPFEFSLSPSAPAIAAPTQTSSAARKKPVNRRVSGTILAVVAVGLLILTGVGVWIYVQNLPVYSGAVAGGRVPGEQAITVTVSWTTLEIPGGVQTQIIEYFKRRQTSLTNNLLKIDLSAAPQGLTVRFATTEDSILVSVDPQLVPDIKTLIAENKTAWETARERELKQFAQELCNNIAKAQATGTRVENVSAYRDSVALNALVHGLGRHCVAIANKTTHPCVFEDDKGILYFAVPSQVREIIVLEKSTEGRVKQLPPNFEIRASVPPAESATPRFEKDDTSEEPGHSATADADVSSETLPTQEKSNTEMPDTENRDTDQLDDQSPNAPEGMQAESDTSMMKDKSNTEPTNAKDQ